MQSLDEDDNEVAGLGKRRGASTVVSIERETTTTPPSSPQSTPLSRTKTSSPSSVPTTSISASYGRHLCVVVFGLSSWALINAIFTEVPLFVTTLPEQWTLSSYLSVSLQCANIFPFLHFLATTFLSDGREIVPYSISISLLLLANVTVCVLLSFFWDVTYSNHSVGLIGITFLAGAVDCTSSLIYWPFISGYPASYIGALTAGESLSATVPALIGLIQQPTTDQNSSTIVPRFSISTYFLLVGGVVACSASAFALLLVRMSRDQPTDELQDQPRQPHLEVTRLFAVNNRSDSSSSLSIASDGDINGRTLLLSEANHPTLYPTMRQVWSVAWLPLVLQFWYEFLGDGISTAIVPIAVSGYANADRVLVWCVILPNVLQPLASLSTMHSRFRSTWICTQAVIWSLMFAWVLYVALLSPHQPLTSLSSAPSWSGALLLILAVNIQGCVGAYNHTMIFLVLGDRCRAVGASEKQRTTAFRWAGLSTQIGAFCGAWVAFACVYHGSVFHQATTSSSS